MIDELSKEGILKEEKVIFLKSKLNGLQGKLYLTPNRLVLDAHKTGARGLGLVGMIVKRHVEKKRFGFNLEFKDVKEIG